MDLELADSRTEVFSVSECLESWTRSVETLERQGIATPVNFDALPLQSKEDDQGGDGNGARESGSCYAMRK